MNGSIETVELFQPEAKVGFQFGALGHAFEFYPHEKPFVISVSSE
jgi:hypothetical protein